MARTNFPSLSRPTLNQWPKNKCGQDSVYIDCMDIRKELMAKSSRVLSLNMSKIGLVKSPAGSKGVLSTPSLKEASASMDDDMDSTESESDKSHDAPQFGTEEHSFRSPAPRPIGSPLARDISVDLMRYRSASPQSRRKLFSCPGRDNFARSPFPSCRFVPVSQPQITSFDSCSEVSERNGPSDSTSIGMSKQYVTELSDIYDLEGKEQKLIQKTALVAARAAMASMKKSFQTWREYYGDRLVQKQQIIDQYSSCCSYLKRSPFLKIHLRRFLMSPGSDRFNLSGCGISSKDMTALICALSGQGCNLKKDRATSIQVVRGVVSDEPMSSMNLSCNSLGADGTITYISVLLQADFFRFERAISSAECVGMHSALTDLDLSRNSIGIAGSAAIENLLAAPNCTIKSLVLCSNMLADPGCAMIFRALKHNLSLISLNMSDNGASNAAGHQIGLSLEANSVLSHLNLAYNHLRGDGAKRIGYGLGNNKTIKKLDLQWNGFGDEDTISELAKAIPSCGVTELNLAHNRIKLKGATILSSFLEGGSNLKELVLDGNLIGQIGARMLFRAVQEASKRGQEFRTAVRTESCGTHLVDRGAFDPCETAGDYELDLRDPYSRTVLCNLIRTSITGSGSFLSIRAGGKLTLYNASVNGMFVKISNNGSIDTDDWTVCTAGGVNLPIAEQRDGEGQPIPLVKTWARLLNRPEESTSCTLTFAFRSDRKRATASDALSERNLEILRDVFSNSSSTSEKCIETIDIIFGSDTFISIEQAQLLLGILSSTDPARNAKLSAARIAFVARCFHKIVETDRNSEIIGRLTSIEERKALQKALGNASFEYTPNNPTGHHKLDLSESAQRDICLRMLEIKNEMEPREEQLRSFYASGKRAGGRREDGTDAPELERVWRNCRLNGAALPYRDGWKVPRSGTLEVDFVAVTKPGMGDMPLPKADCTPELAFQRVLDSLTAHEDEQARVALLRRYSNTDLFTCRQLATILALFDEPQMRVEVCVIAFARTIDWHGFQTVIQALRPRELKVLYGRLGYVNLFDDVMAVNFYELDLENASERFVLQELLHLASVEPGDNFVDCTYQGIDFTPPAGWLKDVPRTGVISLYYCREQQVIEKIFTTGSWDKSGSPFHTREDGTEFGPSSWSTFTPRWLVRYCEQSPQAGPVPCSQPRDGTWARQYKLRRIKSKMADKFRDPRDMFRAMDRDGGGALDRKELAMGLFALGVWLAPTELQSLLETLDQDGGGDIDLEEFRSFWKAYSFD